MKKKQMLVNVKEETFEKCRVLIKNIWGLELSNQNLVDFIANYYVVTMTSANDDAETLRKKVINEIGELKKLIVSKMGKDESSFGKRTPLRTLEESYKAYKEKKNENY